MSEMINRYETRQMIDAIRLQEPKTSFFRTNFFESSNDVYSPTEKIEWDEVREGAAMARYVHPRLSVEPTTREPFVTHEITTPKMQEARILTADDLKKRSAGENPYSLRTPAERAAELSAKDFQFCMDSIDARIEEQCANMMVDGRVEIVGVGVGDYVDFGKTNTKEILTGTSRFGQSGINPLKVISQWFNELLKRGYTADRIIMSPDVWETIEKNEEVRRILDNRRMEYGGISPEGITKFGQAQYVATLAAPSPIEFYTYNVVYKDFDGIVKPYLPEGSILLITPESRRNRMMYGAVTIMDETDQFVTVEGRYVPEIFRDRRAVTERIQVTSRALPTPYDIDSWYSASVL